MKGDNIMAKAYDICREQMRAPVVETESVETLQTDFVAEPNDKWMSFTRDLIANAKFAFSLDEMGRVLFEPKQDTASLQPVHTYNDDNSSILSPDRISVMV